MRKLTNQEKELTNKGIARLKKEISDIENMQEIFSLRIEFMKVKEKYEMKMIPFKTESEVEEAEKTIGECKSKIDGNKKSIEEMEKHIKFGVEEKIKPETKMVG